ncbi:hypothetical protein FQN54_006100 [Arachnomyces sp. PD_36]|nr:hypothetical protein FQN54_006100 [Arachnomyces sp. PD_36]
MDVLHPPGLSTRWKQFEQFDGFETARTRSSSTQVSRHFSIDLRVLMSSNSGSPPRKTQDARPKQRKDGIDWRKLSRVFQTIRAVLFRPSDRVGRALKVDVGTSGHRMGQRITKSNIPVIGRWLRSTRSQECRTPYSRQNYNTQYDKVSAVAFHLENDDMSVDCLESQVLEISRDTYNYDTESYVVPVANAHISRQNVLNN